MRRQPGIIGLWEDPFPRAESLRAVDAPHAYHAGPPAHFHSVVGTTGLTTPSLLDGVGYAPVVIPVDIVPERFRIVIFNGYAIKVRDVPQWMAKARAIVNPEMTPDKADMLLPLVWMQRPERRADVGNELLSFIRSTGKQDIAAAFESLMEKRVSEWRESRQQQDQDPSGEQE